MISTHRATGLIRLIGCLTLLLPLATRADSSWKEIYVKRQPAGFYIGNQGAGDSNCIGWACRSALLGEPTHPSGRKVPSAGAIYFEAIRQVGDPSKPIALRHGADALRDLGTIEAYRNLRSPEEIWEWLAKRGPVVAAVYWDELMTAHRGSLRAVPVSSSTAEGREAHAITILGWSPSREAFYFTPNLGREWGRKGFAFLRAEDLGFVFVEALGLIHENTSASEPLALGLPQGQGEGPFSHLDRAATTPESRAALLLEALDRVDAARRIRSRPIKVGATAR